MSQNFYIVLTGTSVEEHRVNLLLAGHIASIHTKINEEEIRAHKWEMSVVRACPAHPFHLKQHMPGACDQKQDPSPEELLALVARADVHTQDNVEAYLLTRTAQRLGDIHTANTTPHKEESHPALSQPQSSSQGSSPCDHDKTVDAESKRVKKQTTQPSAPADESKRD